MRGIPVFLIFSLCSFPVLSTGNEIQVIARLSPPFGVQFPLLEAVLLDDENIAYVHPVIGGTAFHVYNLRTGQISDYLRPAPRDVRPPIRLKMGRDGFRHAVYRKGNQSIWVRAQPDGTIVSRTSLPYLVLDFDVGADGTLYFLGISQHPEASRWVHALRDGAFIWHALGKETRGISGAGGSENLGTDVWYHLFLHNGKIHAVFRDRVYILNPAGKMEKVVRFSLGSPWAGVEQIAHRPDGSWWIVSLEFRGFSGVQPAATRFRIYTPAGKPDAKLMDLSRFLPEPVAAWQILDLTEERILVQTPLQWYVLARKAAQAQVHRDSRR